MPDKNLDSSKLDAWLAGDLPADEAKSLEETLEVQDLPETLSGDLLLDLDQTQTSSDLGGLVERIKTLSGDEQPIAAADSWRQWLLPSKKEGTLGLMGDYEIIEPIARGGMATVLKAHEPKLDRIVALKVLPPELSANRDARERFLREARAAAQLEHENILPIFEVSGDALQSSPDAASFFAMRYVPTGTLQDALDRGETFDTARLKALARGVAGALETAHRSGIVHRDIKPANILLGENNEQLWVCDFGIARGIEEPSMSYSGTIVGTPQYMSPEQAKGKELDGRSDLFSLGAILYRCATGQRPFEGDTTTLVLENLASATPKKATTHNPSLPAWFSDLISKLLAKPIDERPPDAKSVLNVIENESLATNQRRRKTFAYIGIGVACLLIVAAAVIQLPASKSAINHHLARDLGQVITINGRIGVYTSLAEAVERARSGDAILLPGGEAFTIDELNFAAKKELTLRSAAPSERAKILTQQSIHSAAAVTFIGIDFEIPPSQTGPIIKVEQSHIEFTDCRFSAPQGRLPAPHAQTPCAVALLTDGSVSINSSQFDPSIAVPFRIAGGGEIAISLTDAEATAACMISLPEATTTPTTKITIEAEGCNLAATNFYSQFHPNQAEITCKVSDCRLTIGGRLCRVNTFDPEGTLQRFRWVANGNHYPTGKQEAQFGKATELANSLLVPVTHANPSTGELPLEPIPGKVTIESSGTSFSKLADAIAAANDGDTLHLSGYLDCPEPIRTPQGQTLTIRAAEGESPTIATRLKNRSALILLGPSTLSGIRFVRHDSVANAMPLVAIDADGGEILIENCKFFSTPGNLNSAGHRGVGITQCKTATIKDCYFHVLGGNCIVSGPAAPDLQVEDSLLIGATIVTLRSSGNEPRSQLTIMRSTLVCANAITRDPRHPFDGVDCAIHDSITYLLSSGFSLADVAASELASLITWNGDNNTYRPRVPFLRTRRVHAPKSFEPVIIYSIEQKEKWFPEVDVVRDTNSTFLEAFDMSELPLHLVSPDSLLERIHPEVNSPGFNSIKRFTSAKEQDRPKENALKTQPAE